jgi:hypothetical protein
MKHPVRLWKLVIKYYHDCQYLAGIQWENDEEKISETTQCERLILEHFGLPPALKFSEILQFFSLKNTLTAKSIKKLFISLTKAATTYFLHEPVLTDKAMLSETQLHELSAYDVLPVLGFETSVYTVFLIEQMLIKKSCPPDKILQELKVVSALSVDESIILYQARHNERKLKQYFLKKLKYILKYHRYEMKKHQSEKEYHESIPF